MSRLTDLIRQAKTKDPQLGADLEAEVRELTRRRSFGLVFERHQPEAIELPGVAASVGSKVRVLPPRGEIAKGDERLWRVTARNKQAGVLDLVELDAPIDAQPESQTAAENNMVVVSEFQDRVYPGLLETGRVERGGGAPFHTVINGENFHALQMLEYTHRGKVDAIYIDPPYNTGAKDWKYNNDYVHRDDSYRHSKWLAMMERRLEVAKELLNPEGSVLIVTIDEKEYLRLGLLLEQVFPDAQIQMTTSVISAKGNYRPGRFSRVEEHIYFVSVGTASISASSRDMLDQPEDFIVAGGLEWLGLRRREPSSVRTARPNQFYPVFVDLESGRIVSVGDAIDPSVSRESVSTPSGLHAIWPLKPDGTEMLWGLTPAVLARYLERGYARVNNWKPSSRLGTVQYLPGGTVERIEAGIFPIVGHAEDGSVVCELPEVSAAKAPKRVWNMPSHNAESGGTNVLSAMVGSGRFQFPKSLYAVEDALRFFVLDRPEAIILDFFSGSGTTAHAVMRLNKQDGGRRQCISITNNEVGSDEQKQLRIEGLRPGDPDWEQWGICDFITKPRIEAAITGKTPDGDPIKGDYKFTDEFPMADGFDQNAAFFTLTYERPMTITRNRAYARIAPLLWLRAGSTGPVLTDIYEDGWSLSDTYGVLADGDAAPGFVAAVEARPSVRTAFIITDEDTLFRAIARDLPEQVETVRLYESYMHTFEIPGGAG